MTKKYFGTQERGLVFAALGFGLATLRCGSGANSSSSDGSAAGEHASNAGATASSAGTTASDAGATGSDAGATNSAGGAEDVGGFTAQAGTTAAQAGSAGGDLPPGPETLSYVFSKQTVPLMNGQFAADLDGDGSADNAYAKLNAVIAANGADLQATSDAETAAGRGLQLLALSVPNSSLMASIGLSSELSRAIAKAAPDFGGTGSFKADGSAPTCSFVGSVFSSQFTNVPVAQGSTPQRLLLRLEFGGPVDVPVEIYGLSFHVTETGITVGQLNGAILASDVEMYVPPALAASFNQACTAQPNGTACKMALSLFDTNKDNTVSADEVGGNSLLKALLAPDVKLLDADGHYTPDPANAVKDSFSVGIGFSAARATITH